MRKLKFWWFICSGISFFCNVSFSNLCLPNTFICQHVAVLKKGSVFVFPVDCWKVTLHRDNLNSRKIGLWYSDNPSIVSVIFVTFTWRRHFFMRVLHLLIEWALLMSSSGFYNLVILRIWRWLSYINLLSVCLDWPWDLAESWCIHVVMVKAILWSFNKITGPVYFHQTHR